MEAHKFLQMLKLGSEQPELRAKIHAYLDEHKHPSTAASLKLIADSHWKRPALQPA